MPGSRWERELDDQILRADLILCLVSADFLASDYCWGKELRIALEREQRGEAAVLPVIVRACIWNITPLAKLLAVPKDGKPVDQ